MSNLESLDCSGCSKIRSIPLFPNLESLDCNDCLDLIDIPVLPKLNEVWIWYNEGLGRFKDRWNRASSRSGWILGFTRKFMKRREMKRRLQRYIKSRDYIDLCIEFYSRKHDRNKKRLEEWVEKLDELKAV